MIADFEAQTYTNNKFRPGKPVVMFGSVDTGSGQVIAPVIKEVDREELNWLALTGERAGVEIAKTGFSGTELRRLDIEELMDKYQPRAVVTGISQSGVGVETSLIFAAKASERKVPVIWVADSANGTGAAHLLSLYEQGIYPDVVCVQDDSSKEAVQTVLGNQFNRPDNLQVVVTGNPSHDEIYAIVTNRSMRRAIVREQLGINPDSKSIFFQGQLDGTAETLEELIDTLNSSNPDVDLVFRAHNREPNPEKYLPILSKYHGTFIEIKSGIPDTDSLILSSDITTSAFSLTNMRSILLGVPTMYLLFEEQARRMCLQDLQISPEALPMVNNGSSIRVDSRDELGGVVERLLNDDEVKNLLADARNRNYILDGHNADRVVRQIKNFAL